MELLHYDENKIKKLNKFMKELIVGSDKYTKKEIYDKYADTINDVTPLDIFYLDMYKQNTSYSIDEIKEEANRFVNVFYHGLVKVKKEDYDHIFFKSLLKENRSIERHLNSLKVYYKRNEVEAHKSELIKGFEVCLQFEKKFIKKENILFPHLEKVLPSTKPLEVMWSLHDDARKLVKDILFELKKEVFDEKEFLILMGEYYYLILGLNIKDELILLPVSDMTLSNDVLNEIYSESFEYGYALTDIIPDSKYFKEVKETVFEGSFKTKTGSLSFKEIDLLFNVLPLDITFVDKNNRVKYFNDRPERHFPRNPSVIGRLVKHCHPPKSVQVVEDIVEAFKNGTKDFADFWITFKGSTLYITYYAVRDNDNNYIGVLEVSQDITYIKTLEGSKKLLDWDK